MSKLNSNIRCIEMWQGCNPTPDRQGWIVTLDVLKSGRNKLPLLRIRPLNSNIRCIEILFSQTLTSFLSRWIVTLDVLKCILKIILRLHLMCWIVTLDVLKLCIPNPHFIFSLLNSNIRCIEMNLLLTE